MKFKEPKTFRDATSPARLISWALGLGAFEYPAGYPRRALSICWSITYLILLLNFMILAEQQNFQTSNFSSVISAIHVIFVIHILFGVIVYIYCGQLQSKKMMESVYELDRVDELLRKLGNANDYMSIFKYQIIHFIGIFLFRSMMLTFRTLIIWKNISSATVYYVICEQYSASVVFLVDYIFSNYMRCIGKRFQQLNVSLDELRIQEGYYDEPFQLCLLSDRHKSSLQKPMSLQVNVKPRCSKIADRQRVLHRLRDARAIHRDLCSTAKKLNEVFGVQILLSISVSLFVITSALYSIYSTLVTSSKTATNITVKILYNLLWLSACTFKVIWIVSACSMASTEAQQIGDILPDLVDPTTSHEIREEIHAFSLQIIQNRLKFTACGFFTLDYEIIRSMIGTATTYLVLMIQISRASNVAPGSTDTKT